MEHVQSELERQKMRQKEVRARLFSSPVVRKVVTPSPELLEKIDALEKKVYDQKREINELVMALSDANAIILSQAHTIRSHNKNNMAGDAKRDIEEIVGEVLEGFPGITWDDIISPRRASAFVKPRAACMKAVYQQRPDLSSPQIGKIFKRDHTTILQAVKKDAA